MYMDVHLTCFPFSDRSIDGTQAPLAVMFGRSNVPLFTPLRCLHV